MIEKRTCGCVVKVDVEVYGECKYTAAKENHEEVFENAKRIRYDNVESWDIVSGTDAEQIEIESDGSCIDDMHEYLVLHFTDGDVATFRNSYVDMFRVH